MPGIKFKIAKKIIILLIFYKIINIINFNLKIFKLS